MPNALIFRYRLLRSTPSTSAVRDMLPCCSASVRRIRSRSNRSRASCSVRRSAASARAPARAPALLVQEAQIVDRDESPGTMIISRSITLRSSRTLPGQG